jgi:hypothetical protein
MVIMAKSKELIELEVRAAELAIEFFGREIYCRCNNNLYFKGRITGGAHSHYVGVTIEHWPYMNMLDVRLIKLPDEAPSIKEIHSPQVSFHPIFTAEHAS